MNFFLPPIFQNRFYFLLLLVQPLLVAQPKNEITLEQCYELAKWNYPLIQKFELIEKTNEFSLNNTQRGVYPKAIISGFATYQSDVVEFPNAAPNSGFPVLSKDQYKLYGEISQSLTDLVTYNDAKDLIEAKSAINSQKNEVELFKLKERINNIYFSILLFDEQLKQTELKKADIQSGIEKAQISIENGTALRSSADNLKAELLKSDQHTIELNSQRQSFIKTLALFIATQIDERTEFEMPQTLIADQSINRPELKMFDLQKKSLDLQTKQINNKNLPHLSLFFQGGLARPGFNILNNDITGYYITGLRLSWNLAGYYSSKNDKQLIQLQQKEIEVEKETFLFNTQITLSQQNSEIDKMEKLVTTDQQIIPLLENVKNSSLNQLKYGTATTNDYILAVNAVDTAKLNLVIHQIQLLLAQYALQTTTGN